MFRRDKDTRRTAEAVRDHRLTMEAFGRAAGGWERSSFEPGHIEKTIWSEPKTTDGGTTRTGMIVGREVGQGHVTKIMKRKNNGN